MSLRFDAQGWLISGAKKIPSPNADERPDGAVIDLLVVHNISLPAGVYGGSHIQALFTGTIDTGAHPSFLDLAGLRVSAHFLIRRDGEIIQFVGLGQRAWHAGQSSFQGRTGCNDFSIGIELEGCDADGFTDLQMAGLAELAAAITQHLPSLRWVAGHSDIAPGRKTDPGPNFNWADFLQRLGDHGCVLERPFSDSV